MYCSNSVTDTLPSGPLKREGESAPSCATAAKIVLFILSSLLIGSLACFVTQIFTENMRLALIGGCVASFITSIALNFLCLEEKKVAQVTPPPPPPIADEIPDSPQSRTSIPPLPLPIPVDTPPVTPRAHDLAAQREEMQKQLKLVPAGMQSDYYIDTFLAPKAKAKATTPAGRPLFRRCFDFKNSQVQYMLRFNPDGSLLPFIVSHSMTPVKPETRLSAGPHPITNWDSMMQGAVDTFTITLFSSHQFSGTSEIIPELVFECPEFADDLTACVLDIHTFEKTGRLGASSRVVALNTIHNSVVHSHFVHLQIGSQGNSDLRWKAFSRPDDTSVNQLSVLVIPLKKETPPKERVQLNNDDYKYRYLLGSTASPADTRYNPNRSCNSGYFLLDTPIRDTREMTYDGTLAIKSPPLLFHINVVPVGDHHPDKPLPLPEEYFNRLEETHVRALQHNAELKI